MKYLQNLSSIELVKGCEPWEFVPEIPIPENIRTNKTERTAWINNRKTKHYVYSMFIGVNDNLRISTAKADESGNPVHSCIGFAVDYDHASEESSVMASLAKLPIPPNWVEKTLSGNWRAVWLFERPILFPSHAFAIHFFEVFIEISGLDVSRGAIGFDQGAFEDPARTFTNGCDWRPLNKEKIPHTTTQGWLVKASGLYKWTKGGGISIPLDVIAPALAKKYPTFAQWPGEFSLDSQGPTFWVPGSVSPKSAIVRPQGIQTFSDHAPKAFYSWADLLDITFVKQYETEAAARATEGLFHDGKHYHRQLHDRAWKHFEKGDLTNHLRVSRGVSPKPDKSGTSDIDRCVEFIQEHQRVDGAAPFIFRPSGRIYISSRPVLNTNTRVVLPPAPGPATWGAEGKFPWLSEFYGRMHPDVIALERYLAWLAYAYRCGLKEDPNPGQALFMAGVQDSGKTLNPTMIVGPLLGGSADASAYLSGVDKFGSDLFHFALWSVDDSLSASDYRTNRIFSETLKRAVANSNLQYHEKFRVPLMVEWMGRIMISLNCDEESMRRLPDLEISILDKLMLFRAGPNPINFPSREKIRAILAVELPHFARFLADWIIPDHCLGKSRFHVACYHDAWILNNARLSSKTAGFAEILEDWKQDYFGVREPKAEVWTGMALQLQKEFLLDPTAEMAVRAFNVDAIGRALSSLMNKGAHIECDSEGDVRIWKIYKS